MILQKPCPPCCTTTAKIWPQIRVHDDFYKYSKAQKISALEQVIVDRAKLEKVLRPVIEYLQGGHDIKLKLM